MISDVATLLCILVSAIPASHEITADRYAVLFVVNYRICMRTAVQLRELDSLTRPSSSSHRSICMLTYCPGHAGDDVPRRLHPLPAVPVWDRHRVPFRARGDLRMTLNFPSDRDSRAGGGAKCCRKGAAPI